MHAYSKYQAFKPFKTKFWYLSPAFEMMKVWEWFFCSLIFLCGNVVSIHIEALCSNALQNESIFTASVVRGYMMSRLTMDLVFTSTHQYICQITTLLFTAAKSRSGNNKNTFWKNLLLVMNSFNKGQKSVKLYWLVIIVLLINSKKCYETTMAIT